MKKLQQLVLATLLTGGCTRIPDGSELYSKRSVLDGREYCVRAEYTGLDSAVMVQRRDAPSQTVSLSMAYEDDIRISEPAVNPLRDVSHKTLRALYSGVRDAELKKVKSDSCWQYVL